MILAILTGGKSKRFGKDKCSYEINGMSSVEWIIKSIGSLFDGFILVGENEILSKKCIPDLIPTLGPISGLHTALVNSKEDIFLISCDMPFVMKNIVKIIIEKNSYPIICPKIGNIYQVTHACYSKEILPSLEKEIYASNHSLTHFVVNYAQSLILEENTFKQIKGYEMSFRDFDLPDDLQKYV